ncbi:MAG: hypothetical protein P1U41_05735 [Vicingaceae bacterium]|nr:hypothetical protein [Vicingaceae bacterium]
MNTKFLYIFAAILGLVLLFTSCKKDRGPRLIVNVKEADGTIAKRAIVRAWYGPNAGQPGSILNTALMDQTTRTDGAGDAIFDFKYSAVLDVDVIYYKEIQDSLNPTIYYTDTLYGHQVIKIEQVRQKSKENNYNMSIKVK